MPNRTIDIPPPDKLWERFDALAAREKELRDELDSIEWERAAIVYAYTKDGDK